MSLEEKSITSKYHSLYWNLVKKIKKENIKVIHRKLNGCYGLAVYKTRTITISHNIAGTITGIIILLHEKRHILHQANNHSKYSQFYKLSKFQKEIHTKLIWSAEWDCFKYAQKTLRRWNIDVDNYLLLNKRWVKNNLLPLWIEEYCQNS